MIKKLDIVFLVLLLLLAFGSSWFNLRKYPVLDFREEATVEESEVEKPEDEEPAIPDFAEIRDVKTKKTTFFAFMKELVDAENARLYQLRLEILALHEKEELRKTERQRLFEIAGDYRLDWNTIPEETLYGELLNRVDEIPVSLALVQAANESAWGTSRFALNANNFFGQWCFTEGCGLVPTRRPEGASFEVRKFDTVADSVRSYMYNLNSNHHYSGLREMRLKLRQQGKPVTGPVLAHGLYSYSIRGGDYVDELITMIAVNDLLRYDLAKAEKKTELQDDRRLPERKFDNKN
ncbi:MAG: glucosaminidase domain-containing protein [Endozoicomonas sp.]